MLRHESVEIENTFITTGTVVVVVHLRGVKPLPSTSQAPLPPHSPSYRCLIRLCQVGLEIMAAVEGNADDEGPEFVGTMKTMVAAGVATFTPPVVKWNKPLKPEGELAVVDATLSIGTGSSEWWCLGGGGGVRKGTIDVLMYRNPRCVRGCVIHIMPVGRVCISWDAT